MLTEFPASIRTLAQGESRPLDEAELLARLRAAWVTDLVPYQGEGFRGVVIWFDDFPISIDNIWGESDSPVADALDDAVAVAQKWDLFRRLQSAWMDIDQILHATRVLIEARPEIEPGVLDLDALDHTIEPLHEVIETGIVTMYARHFDGERELPGRWRPKGKRKPTHDWLIARRNTIVAHVDETIERRIVAMPTEGPGPPIMVPAERRMTMSNEDLQKIVHHCEALWRRYSDATLQLKWDLGMGASGELFGPDTYDE